MRPSTRATEGLQADDFRLICQPGFGDGYNNYAHSMVWFSGRLFVGTTRANFAMMRAALPLPNLKPWPVWSPENLYDIDRRAEIWCYTPEKDRWQRVYRAPWAFSKKTGRNVPRYVGLRGMTVYRATGDPAPCLYVATWAPQLAEPPDILRSADGEHFENVARPPWDDTVRSFRSLQPFRGRLHTTPTGSNPGGKQAQDSVSSTSAIYAADDLRGARWQPTSEDGFGNPANVTVFEMEAFNDHLYAGTVNPFSGFELWKTDGDGGPPYRWTRVLQRGAWRGVHNEVVGSLYAFKGALYIGTGVVNGGYHRRFDVGPAAPELIRVWPDDSWDLLVGNARITPEGAKVPLSGHSPGFDNLFNGYFWRMCVHEEQLYVGTLNWANVLPYLPTHLWPEDTLVQLRRWGAEHGNPNFGGFGLWRSGDGIRWHAVTRSGFGNKYNWGVRNFASTPHGLFVGTANVFGPNMAMEREGGWQYLTNPRGGVEVYLGRKDRADDAQTRPGKAPEASAPASEARRPNAS